MNSDLRNRIVLPVLLPILVLLGTALAVGSFALVFLYTTRVLALTIAIVASAGIMGAIALANSIDEEDMTVARRSVIVMTGALPVVVGMGIALWAANGGIPADELNINKEPALAAPEGALVGAKNDQAFCVFTDPEAQTDVNCEDTTEVTFPAQPAEGPFLFVFNNLQSAIQHNFQIFELEGSVEAPEPGETLFGVSEGAVTIQGPDSILYNVPPEIGLVPGQYYYNCIVHPVMAGVLTVAEGEGAEGADGGGAEG